jgi:hypothetical protein
MGYKNVIEYPGGKQDWGDAGLPLYSSHKHGEDAA